MTLILSRHATCTSVGLTTAVTVDTASPLPQRMWEVFFLDIFEQFQIFFSSFISLHHLELLRRFSPLSA